MRKTNFISGVFAILGLAAAAAGILLALGNRNAQPVLMTAPDAATEKITQTLDAVCRGDYTAAQENLYGRTDLGLDRAASDPVGQLIWEAFAGSMSYELDGSCNTTASGLAQNVVIRGLDIESVTAGLGERTRALLEKRVEEATDPSELYDENHDFREELVLEVLYEAAQQALEQDAREKTWEVTVNLLYENGQWWLMGESGLLEAISGGIVK